LEGLEPVLYMQACSKINFDGVEVSIIKELQLLFG